MSAEQKKLLYSRRHSSPSANVRVGDAHIVIPLLAMICVMCGASAIGSLWAISEARKPEREARILKINVDGYEKALAFYGIDASKHLPGEPK